MIGVEADVDGTLESATLENLLRSADDSEATDELQEPVIDFSEEESALDEDSLEALQLAVENESDPEQDIDSEMVVDHPDAVSLDAFRDR